MTPFGQWKRSRRERWCIPSLGKPSASILLFSLPAIGGQEVLGKERHTIEDAGCLSDCKEESRLPDLTCTHPQRGGGMGGGIVTSHYGI